MSAPTLPAGAGAAVRPSDQVTAPAPLPRSILVSVGGHAGARPVVGGGGAGGAHIHFGTVDVVEHERMYMESPVSGAPRLMQGKMIHRTLRHMDSLEVEREPVRHHRESIQPLTPAQRRDLAGVGRDLIVDSFVSAPPPTPPAPAPAPAPAPPREVCDASLDNWHLGADSAVYHNGGVTSKVSGVKGRVITTSAHGSKYRLDALKPQVQAVLARLGITFDADAPLANPASLVYAWTVCKHTGEMLECRERVLALKEKLVTFGPSVADCFATIDKAFSALGFPVGQ